MKEVIAVVENGQIRLPPAIQLREGQEVRILWEEGEEPTPRPYDREEWTEADLQAELRAATGRRFTR